MAQLSQESTFSHLEFQISLYSYLFGFVQDAKIYCLQSDLGGKRLFNSNLEHIHCKVKRTQVKTCVSHELAASCSR
jgi:hypothetical protein